MLQRMKFSTLYLLYQLEAYVREKCWEGHWIYMNLFLHILGVQIVHCSLFLVGLIQRILENKNSILLQGIMSLLEQGSDSLISKGKVDPFGCVHNDDGVERSINSHIEKILVANIEIIWKCIFELLTLVYDFYFFVEKILSF